MTFNIASKQKIGFETICMKPPTKITICFKIGSFLFVVYILCYLRVWNDLMLLPGTSLWSPHLHTIGWRNKDENEIGNPDQNCQAASCVLGEFVE